MKTFTIEITETLQRLIDVEANSQEEAYSIIAEKYQNEEIILDDSDYIDTKINFYKKENYF